MRAPATLSFIGPNSFCNNLLKAFFNSKLCLTFAALNRFRDVAQPGSALAWGARGRWFESSRPDK